MIVETERLIMRPLETIDLRPMEVMNADPHIMRFFPAPFDSEATKGQFNRFVAHENEHGFSIYAARSKEDGGFVGLIGLVTFSEQLRAAVPGTATVEIGWRFSDHYWGQGLAPEGAKAWLDVAWARLGLEEVVAITYRGNAPSRRVMEKIGMDYDPVSDFEHPNLAEDCPVRSHVLYRTYKPN